MPLRYALTEPKLTAQMLDTLTPQPIKPAVDVPWIRRVTTDDVPWLLSLAYKRYGPYDPGVVVPRLMEAMNRKHDWLVARAEKAFVLANLFIPPWRAFDDHPECNIVVLCADYGGVWHAVRVARYSLDWAKEKGCLCWWFGSETDYDISAIARRLGGAQALPRYRVKL